MKALRSLSLHKHFLSPTIRNPIPDPFRLSSHSHSPTLQNATFSRNFHSTSFLFTSDAPNSRIDPSSDAKPPRVWTVFDPVSGRIVTQKVKHGELQSEGETQKSSSESGDAVGEHSPEERSYGSFRKVKSVGLRDVVGNKKKGRVKTLWVCSSCGHTEGQWWGMCRSCDAPGTMTEVLDGDSNDGKIGGGVSEKVGSWLPKKEGEVLPIRLKDVQRVLLMLRPGLFGNEVARVLGGGLVPGCLVLVGGDPGVGKSTLLLQVAALISEGCDFGGPAPVVYVSGEESIEQIGNRADRMDIKTEELFLYSSTDIEDIIQKAHILSPRALIIDSIQTVYLNNVTGSAGGLSQVKECTSALLRFAKKTNIPVLLIGHVTKSGEIAGPRVLEHIVDVVLYMEGEKYSSHRLLRSVKNRFGSTDELGVFEMSQSGLQAVVNPSEMFLSEEYAGSEVLAGLAVAVTMDGSRSFLIEIQALCVSSSTVSRQVNGVQASRADMIISVLIKQAGLKLQENLAGLLFIIFLEFPIPNNIAFIGEIGLAGEIRTVPRMDKRIHTVAKLGYKKCIIPKSAEKSLATSVYEGMTVVGCRNLKERKSLEFFSVLMLADLLLSEEITQKQL
ncbi:DNA repair protein RadA-like protein [Morus notabilis]|uniref:DNA repair protein RadA-like protein n=1 Tax=Morus notabilis TaxID=981085 RepID=W9R6P1_9ROSA|nr:DNA repair protein RadA-like protein [Morus notabilis]